MGHGTCRNRHGRGGGGRVKVTASRELLAPRPEVWAFLAEPLHLADWWPGIAGVQPDRRGSAAGARWQIDRRSNEPTLLRRPERDGNPRRDRAEPPGLFAFQLAGEKLERPCRPGGDRRRPHARDDHVEGPWLIAYRRTLARSAAGRLYALCQTAASL